MMSLTYDGLNRQVSRTVTGGLSIGGGATFSVWDGWDLIEEYQPGSASATAAYVYGGSDLIAGTYNGQVYYKLFHKCRKVISKQARWKKA
jgi:hypothetical protein